MSYQCSFYLQIYASWKGWSGRYLCKRGWFSSPWALWVWNNLSGILWMWNPLMRFLLFLDYPHIVSARQPGVGQGCAGGEHCQGGRQAPVLNSLSCLPVFENLDQVNDQNRCMQAPNKIHSCLQNLCTYSMHLSPLFQAVAAVVFCFLCKKFFQRQTWQLRAETLCKMILIRRNAQPFPREATNGRFAINLNTSFHRTDHFHSALPTAPVIKTGFARSSFSKKFLFWNHHQVVLDVFYHISISSPALSPWFRCFFSLKNLLRSLSILCLAWMKPCCGRADF